MVIHIYSNTQIQIRKVTAPEEHQTTERQGDATIAKANKWLTCSLAHQNSLSSSARNIERTNRDKFVSHCYFFWETKFQCVSWADLWTSTLIHFKSFKAGTGKMFWFPGTTYQQNYQQDGRANSTQLGQDCSFGFNPWRDRIDGIELQTATDFPADLTVCSKWFQESDQLVFHIFKPLHLQISSCSCSASASAATPAITLQLIFRFLVLQL